MTPIKSIHTCLSCGSSEWHENQSFGELPRVTSDSVPFSAHGRICVCLRCGLIQKIIDERWKSEIDSIYGNYKMYELTSGADQTLFGEGGMTRAQKVVELIAEQLPPNFSGSVLDIGCGTGGFLDAFGKRFPKAALCGQEIDDKNIHYLKRIPNFKTLFTAQKPAEEIFDVVVSIHCFEHLYDYASFFREIQTLRKETTCLLIQVPDVDTSPFDIVVADHAAHFSQNTLQDCLNRHFKGFTVSRPINKELTAIATPSSHSPASPPAPSKEESTQALDTHVHYLARMLALIEDRQLNEFGVYGTTIAGAWLTSAHRDKIAFYVDDDPLKQGKIFHDKKVIAANQVPDDCKLVLPFEASTTKKILSNHPNLLPMAVYYDQ